MSLSHRTLRPELLDDPDLPAEEVAIALRGLRRVNRVLSAGRTFAARIRPGRVLDVACGAGDVAGWLTERGAALSAIGLDYDPRVLAAARRLTPTVPLVRGNALRLPFPDQSFDTAISHHFLHHLPDSHVGAVLTEMRRVAKRVVAVDLARSRRLLVVTRMFTALSPSRIIRWDGPASVRNAFTLPEMRELLQRAGLSGQVEPVFFSSMAVVIGDDR